MLTIEKCREILGCDCPELDADVEKLRDSLYTFARIAVEMFPQYGEGSRFIEAMRLLPEDWQYEVEERAGILEFDGGHSCKDAERLAFNEQWRTRYKRN